jgi:hypothetical protein
LSCDTLAASERYIYIYNPQGTSTTEQYMFVQGPAEIPDNFAKQL